MNTTPSLWDYLLDLLGLSGSTAAENVEAGVEYRPGG